jgi:twitching motility protein PilJ
MAMTSIVSALRFPSVLFGKKLPNTPDAPEVSPEQEAEGTQAERNVGEAIHPIDAIKGFTSKDARASARPLPLIQGLKFSQQVRVLSIVVAIFLALAVVALGLSMRDTRLSRAQALVSNEMQVLSQRIAILAQQAVQGDASAFKALEDAGAQLAADLALLRDGGERNGIGIPTPSDKDYGILGEIAEAWKPIDAQIATIVEQQRNLPQLRKHEEIVAKSGARILALTQQLAQGSVSRNEDIRATAWTKQLYADTVNLDLLDATSLASTDHPSAQVALPLVSRVEGFLKTLKGLLEGNSDAGIGALKHPANRDTAAALLKVVSELESSLDAIVRNMHGVAQAKQAARNIPKTAAHLLSTVIALTNQHEDSSSSWGWLAAGIVFSALTLLGLALVAKVILDDVRARGTRSEEENRRNEQAILRLLDDMSDLAEGDLTKHALVTEDVTGAIADSVNYAIDQLRSLVAQIEAASCQLSESSSQGRTVSGHLLQVADKQSNQIQEAAASVLQMASTIDAVAESASKCAAVAEQSLSASSKGTGAIHDSISGMNILREQIQETSKRIKRLGESSQEIGEIVQLISGITEQTNVLALNAAIQAAAAGEAGRGFSVVAEEVQRLAERSGEATKQIGAIVKAIQSDTQDAVTAMEKSTHGVVQGATLVDSAGRALDEIREVSHRLAEFVASISSSTQSQQKVAKHLAQRMQDILGITTQSSKGTKWTADSMVKISELANKLKVSVSGFKV